MQSVNYGSRSTDRTYLFRARTSLPIYLSPAFPNTWFLQQKGKYDSCFQATQTPTKTQQQCRSNVPFPNCFSSGSMLPARVTLSSEMSCITAFERCRDL